MQGWRLSLGIVCACQAITFIGLAGANPFMPLYIQQLGVTDRDTAAAWAGAINGSAMVIFATMNIIWGAVADRWGLKTGMVRALALGAGGLGLAGFANGPEMVMAGRLLHSIGGGPNSAAMAMVGGMVPTANLGLAMGLLQTCQSVGQALGPAIGGFVGDAFGFEWAFRGASVLTLVVVIIASIFLKEIPRNAPVTGEKFLSGVTYATNDHRLRGLILVLLFFQTGYQVVQGFLPLRMQEIVSDPTQVGTWSGAALTCDAIGIVCGSILFGWLGPRLGVGRVVAGSLAVAAAFTALHIVVTRPEIILGMRLVIGLCAGGIIPSTRALLGTASQARRRAAVFGVAQGAFALAAGIGAVLGSQLLVLGDFPLMFAFAAAILAGASAWAVIATNPRRLLPDPVPVAA